MCQDLYWCHPKNRFGDKMLNWYKLIQFAGALRAPNSSRDGLEPLTENIYCLCLVLYKIGRDHCVCLKKILSVTPVSIYGVTALSVFLSHFFLFLCMLFLFPPQVAPYSPQPIFQPPYTPMLNYIALVQPGYPYQQRTPPTLSSNIQDLSPMAGDGIQYPFSPSYGYGHADSLSIFSVLSLKFLSCCKPAQS